MKHSSTSASAGKAGGSASGGASRSPRASGGSKSRRSATQSSVTARARQAGNSASSMWKFYTGDDSPGYKVGPVPVLVLSLVFIASIFLLHIWGKYARS
ncbi:hypothetical protein EMCRGX_G018685 [Ephydatia muelleri]|eukprot:Em0012g997a